MVWAPPPNKYVLVTDSYVSTLQSLHVYRKRIERDIVRMQHCSTRAGKVNWQQWRRQVSYTILFDLSCLTRCWDVDAHLPCISLAMKPAAIAGALLAWELRRDGLHKRVRRLHTWEAPMPSYTWEGTRALQQHNVQTADCRCGADSHLCVGEEEHEAVAEWAVGRARRTRRLQARVLRVQRQQRQMDAGRLARGGRRGPAGRRPAERERGHQLVHRNALLSALSHRAQRGVFDTIVISDSHFYK